MIWYLPWPSGLGRWLQTTCPHALGSNHDTDFGFFHVRNLFVGCSTRLSVCAWNNARKGTICLPSSVKLENRHMTYTLLVRCKDQPNNVLSYHSFYSTFCRKYVLTSHLVYSTFCRKYVLDYHWLYSTFDCKYMYVSNYETIICIEVCSERKDRWHTQNFTLSIKSYTCTCIFNFRLQTIRWLYLGHNQTSIKSISFFF
jgi:hypothetical protein